MDYKIDGTTVMSPSEVEPEFNTISEDERAIDTGLMISKFIASKFKINWKYKFISQTELNKITAIVVTGDKNNKNRFHQVTTFNPLTGSTETYTMYCGATIKLKPYMKKGNEYWYKDIDIKWIEK